MNNPEPMPVPNVRTSTTPVTVAAGAELHLGQPGGVGVVDDVHRSPPTAFVNSASASMSIHDLSTLAALWTTPWRTIAGERDPDRALPREVLDQLDHHVGHVLRVRGLRREDLEPLLGQLPGDEIDRRRLHPRPTDVDPEGHLVSHGSGPYPPQPEQLRDRAGEHLGVAIDVGRGVARREQRHVVERRQQHTPVQRVEVEERLEVGVDGAPLLRHRRGAAGRTSTRRGSPSAARATAARGRRSRRPRRP